MQYQVESVSSGQETRKDERARERLNVRARSERAQTSRDSERDAGDARSRSRKKRTRRLLKIAFSMPECTAVA